MESWTTHYPQMSGVGPEALTSLLEITQLVGDLTAE